LKRITILLVLLVLVAGCAGQSGATATPSPTPEPTPTEEPEGSEAAIQSFDLNGDPELAARFPDTVGGEPLTVQSFRGDVFMTGSPDPSFEAFLDSVGAELEDVSVAFGGLTSGDSVLSVGAFRVAGADEDELETEFLAATEAEGDIGGTERRSLGGKDVWTATDPTGEAAGSMFIYVKDDTVYFLTGSEEQAAEILAALP
jgi:hypothetical protein